MNLGLHNDYDDGTFDELFFPAVITMSGAAGSGKTTLVNAVADQLEEGGLRVTRITNIARQLLEDRGVDLNTLRQSPYDYMMYEVDIMYQMYDRLKMAKGDVVICDRSLYDVLVYVVLFAGVEGMYNAAVHQMFTTALDARLLYDHVFLLTPITSKTDSIRTKDDVATQNVQHVLLYNWWSNSIEESKFTVVVEKDLEKRKQIVIDTLINKEII